MSTWVSMKDEVYRLLDLLGSTPWEIAESLANKGVRGNRHLSAHCPLSRWLSAELGHDVYISLNSFKISGELDLHDLPRPASEFVAMFDKGEFSVLDADARPSSFEAAYHEIYRQAQVIISWPATDAGEERADE